MTIDFTSLCSLIIAIVTAIIARISYLFAIIVDDGGHHIKAIV